MEEIEASGDGIDGIWVESMVSARDRKGYVELRWGPMHAQIEPETARELALSILAGAESAEQDAGLMAFCKSAGMRDGAAAGILNAVRQQRNGLPPEGKGGV